MKPKYVLITGSSSGIGKEMAIYCAQKGMNVLLTALPSMGLEDVSRMIKKAHSVESDFYETDLTELKGPERVLEWVERKGYEVDFLINNAGMAGTSLFGKSTLKYNDERIMLNVRALVLLTRLFLPALKKHSVSHILNVGSLAAYFPIPYKSLYSASKAFVVSFSRALRTELKDSGVNVSVVCPNGVRTNEGTNARIDAHGARGRWTAVPAEKVAMISVEKTLKGKFLIIPGRINSILLFLSKIIPASLMQKILIYQFEKEARHLR